MKLNIAVQPETEEEAEFVSLLVEARKYAIEETGLDESEISAIYSQFSSGISTEHDPDSEGGQECPECGETVEDVEAPAIGADPVCHPCGHEVSWADLPSDLY